MAVLLLLFECLHIILTFLLLHGDSLQVEPNFCDPTCSGFSPHLSYQRGVRYTYRYSTIITTTLHGSSPGRNGLALDCVVDIEVVSKCHLMMQIRNPQIKRLSPLKEHSVQRLKSLRESLERTRLKFSLQGGKVKALCLQEGEQVWALNIKRALLSMLQTSPMASKVEFEKETDVYGTCMSRYEWRGPLLIKSRDIKQCQQSRLNSFWPHSVTLTEDTSVQLGLRCVQRLASAVMEEVNCTEVVSLDAFSRTPGLVKTQTISNLLLLRAQPLPPLQADSTGTGVPSELLFEDEGAARQGKARLSTPQKVGHTIRMLCSLSSDPKLVSKEFLQLVFQLKKLSLSQLRTLWREASFKCRNDWQPLLDALPACGSDHCILLLTDLMRNKELEDSQAQFFLTAIGLIPHPSPQIIGSVTALLEVPELWSVTLLTASSLSYRLCQKSESSCSEYPQIQTFKQTLEDILQAGCEGQEPTQVSKLLYALKSVGNLGLSASSFTPLLSRCMLDRSTALELRLVAVKAFRRFPCSADRSVLLQLYCSSQEDTEVRIAAYQQLMRCPDRQTFNVVKTTLKNETSSQVGSFVWSHLTNVLRSEDPMKQALIESLPDDIISRDFEAEFLKYSSYSDYTVGSGIGITNVETSLIFSPKSFLPRSASANLTMYFHGRAHNLLEVEFHVENAEPLLKKILGNEMEPKRPTGNGKDEARTARRMSDDDMKRERQTCSSGTSSFLNQARVMLSGKRKMDETMPKCLVGLKIFGNELSVITCEDLHNRIDQLSLSLAGLVVQLLKGNEVQLSHRALLMTDELLLPSLAGVPIKLGINITSLLSLLLKGNANYRDISHFSLNGFIKPKAHVGLSARFGVDSALGSATVEWVAELNSSTSLDGSIQLQEGRDVRVILNTPEDLMDIISVSSRVFQLSGDQREEIKGPKTRVQKTACTEKTWSKLIGWQLCSNTSYPSLPAGLTFPPPGPVHLSLRLLKLDRGLSHYLLEFAYSVVHQRSAWLPREASIHFLLTTPQSSIPRDLSLDLAFNPHRVLLRIRHPLKTILIQGQLEQQRNIKSGKLELMIDSLHYYIMGLVDNHSFSSEQKTRYYFEVKTAADAHPMILSANITRGLGRKTSFSATLKNVFREMALVSVTLERRRDSSSRQYSLEAELLLPDVVGSRMLGLMEQKGSLWNSVFRLKYGLGGGARYLHQECYTSQRLRSERDSNLTYAMRADHEFFCTSTAPINHKVHIRHEESPHHIKSSLDMSYGKHWDEINNKHKVLLSQSYKNQSSENHTSYTLEFNLQVPEKSLNYRTQLLHSHFMQRGSETSTHLKINYNNLMPLVMGLHWKSPPKHTMPKKWEGSLNMDTPWLYLYAAHKLVQLQRHTLQLTSELTTTKWLTVRNLVLEGFYRDQGREKEARLELYTPAVKYLQVGGRGVVRKQNIKASCSFSSLWTPPLKGDFSLEASQFSHTLQMASTYGHHNVSLAAALNTVDKNLKKRQAVLKLTLSKPKSPSIKVELEGAVEELRKDKKIYQKTALLRFRQPFQILPYTLLLRETFTVDLLKGLYVLESKAGFHDNQDVTHTLTLGYRPPSPFICSALIHPFSSDIVPSDSEICVTVTNNQTVKDIHGRLRVDTEERLTFSGQVQLNSSHSSRRAVKVKAHFVHGLQLQLPSSASFEGDVCWTPKHHSGFDYQARGKLRVERQECRLSVWLNCTSSRASLHSSLTHPFKSKIPKTFEVNATTDISTVPGFGSSSVFVRADGKDKMALKARLFHSVQRGDRAVGLMLNLSQSLIPAVTELHANMTANVSSDSVFLRGFFIQGQESLLAQVKGSLTMSQGVQLVVAGDLRHSVITLNALPQVLGLDAAFGLSDGLCEGQLRVRVMESVYSVELQHRQHDIQRGAEGDEIKSRKVFDWMCVWSGAEHVCVNFSRLLGNDGMGEVNMQLIHTFHLFSATGLPTSGRAHVKWAQAGSQLWALAQLQAGLEHLKVEFNGGKTDDIVPRWQYFSRLEQQVNVLLARGFWSSLEGKAYYQLETSGLDMGVGFHLEEVRMVDMILNIGSRNKTAGLTVSVWQQMELLQGIIPSTLQMNCTGDTTADRLTARCYGNVADRTVETLMPQQSSASISVTHSSCLTNISAVLQADGAQRGRLALSLSWTSEPRVMVHLQLGQCSFMGDMRKTEAVQPDGETSVYAVNVTSYCPSLQGTLLPESMYFRGLLSEDPCRLALSSSLNVDNQDLLLDLSRSCRSPYLSGTLTHSFTGLKSRGLPKIISVQASAPQGREQPGNLLMRIGACMIRANRVIESRGRSPWLWALDSKCPPLQAQVNGSVWQNPQGIFTVILENDLKGERGSLKLSVKPWPELSVEAELSRHLFAPQRLPKINRLRVTSKSGKDWRFEGEALIQMEECVVSAGGAALLKPGLQGSLVYHNNCTVIQELGSPDRMQLSGSVAVATSFVQSHISMRFDESELNSFVSLRKTKDKNEAMLHLNHSVTILNKLGVPGNSVLNMNCGNHGHGLYYHTFDCSAGTTKISQQLTVTRKSETLRMNSYLRHTVDYLKKLGVPANSSIQVELGSAGGKTMALQSQFGGQQAGLRFKMKVFPMTKDIRGTLWHNWSWLHDKGLPLNIEGFCSIQGVLSQLRSRAQLTVDRRKLFASSFNVSSADGHVSVLISHSLSASSRTSTQTSLDTVMSVQFKGPLQSASFDVHSQDWRVEVVGEIGGLGALGGTKEARFTLKHTVQGGAHPALQIEAWGRLTESQLRCSMAVNPELSHALALIVQGHYAPHSKELLVKVAQNIPIILVYLPPQLNVHSQLNQSESRVAVLVEAASGRKRLWTLGELSAIGSGFRQTFNLKHSCPQLKLLPRTVTVRTEYEVRKWNYQLEHWAVWGNQEVSLSGLYSAPPTLELDNQTVKVQIVCNPRLTSLELTQQRSLHGRIDSVSLGWMRRGQQEQVSAVTMWNYSEEMNETRLELRQPFSSTFNQLSLNTVSHSSQRGQHSSHQTRLSWDSGVPVNVSVTLDKQWQKGSSRGRACALLSTQQMAVSPVQGCVSLGQEANSYLQNAELKWNSGSVTQSMKYQKGVLGMHTIQVNVSLDRLSTAPCPSHTLMAKVHTNLRDHVKHTMLVGFCPPQPMLAWSGAHWMNSGEKLFYTRSHLSVSGRPSQCSFTLALINSSSPQGTNMSLLSESRMGNWSVGVRADALYWSRAFGVHLQASLDHKENIWLMWMIDGRCLQTTAGYGKGTGAGEDVTVKTCVETDRNLMMEVRRRDGSDESKPVASVVLGAVNQKLLLKASGCLEGLTAAEERLYSLSTQIRSKLLQRVKTFQRLLLEFRQQAGGSRLLHKLATLPLNISQHAEAVLGRRDRGWLALWQRSSLRLFLTASLPRFLGQLHHASLLGQQELRRPLATLAGVYQDLKGQKLGTMWREVVLSWTDRLAGVLPPVLNHPQLRPLSQATVAAGSFALDVTGQHTYQWIETRLATALSGLRKQLASIYKLSPSECSVIASLPLPPLPRSRLAECGLIEVLLEEWILKPLQSIASLSPTAELYRLKRKLMDSPFAHRALLVADQFIVTFDGHLYELPGSCPLLLAQDTSTDPSFTLVLGTNPNSFLLVQMSNASFHVQRNGQVTPVCHKASAHTFHSENGLTVKKRSNTLHLWSHNGGSLSCDLSAEVCSFTLDGWLHGSSTGLLGTNDNEAGNDFPLRDGSQAENLEDFFQSWQMTLKCLKSNASAAMSPVTCDYLFSSLDSPLSSCFRVVDPIRFLSVCESSSSRAPCRLAAAFVHLCQWNYVPLEVPVQCLKV